MCGYAFYVKYADFCLLTFQSAISMQQLVIIFDKVTDLSFILLSGWKGSSNVFSLFISSVFATHYAFLFVT